MMEEDPPDADELGARVGELHRLTIMYCDVVGSTELSGRLEPETYRELMARYRRACREVIETEFEGHIVQKQGDGVLAVFGFPVAHENDAERAVRAGLALLRAVHESTPNGANVDDAVEIRVAIHHGPLYVDLDDEDVYGLAANAGARLQSIADPGTVVISDEVRKLVEDRFEIEPGEPQVVKGLPEPLQPFRILGDRHVEVKRVWSTPLVERDAELALLQHVWAGSSGDRREGTIGVLISGDAGVGKSRLVAAFVEEVSARRVRVIELHGSPFHVDAGFHPVARLIEHRCEITGDATPATRLEKLEREIVELGLDPSAALPLLAALVGIAPSAGYEPVAAEGPRLQEQIADAATEYVLACATDDPAVVVAENLHWFDDATRGLLAALAERGPQGMLIIGTSREREDGSWETIELKPLTHAGRLELIDALHDGLDEEDRLAFAARSDGVPLYLEELVRAGAEHPPGAATYAAPMPGSVPAALYEPLVARLYVMPAALPIVAAAAAAGQEIDRSLLAATITVPAEEFDSTLRGLLDAEILEPVASRPDRYQFRHELLREVAYELQPPSWRRRVHSRLCDLLTREEPSDWLVVASHFERAERYEEGAGAYREASEAARRRGALEEARSHLTHAIELVAESAAADAELEGNLRLRRGFIAMSLEGVASTDAAADYERCLELADADPRGDAMFSTLISLWAYYLSRADLARARETSVTLRSAITGSRGYFRPANRAGFGMLDWYEGKFTSALEVLSRATDELDETEQGDLVPLWFVPHDAVAAMHLYLAVARFMAADIEGADASLARSREISEGLDFPQGPWSIDYTHWLGAWMWIESGRIPDAVNALAELQTSSAAHGFTTWQLFGGTQTSALRAVAALRSGESDSDALAELAAALDGLIELWKALDLRIFLPFYLTTAGALLAASGDPDGARRRYDESLSLASETGMRFYDAETARRVAHLAPDAEERIARLGDALELARSQSARPFELRIALDLHDLLGEDARSQVELALAAFPSDATTHELEDARARTSAPR